MQNTEKKEKLTTVVSSSNHPCLGFLSSVKNTKKKTHTKDNSIFKKTKQTTLKILQKAES